MVYLAGNDPVLFISYQHDRKKKWPKKIKNVSGAIFIFSAFYLFFFFYKDS